MNLKQLTLYLSLPGQEGCRFFQDFPFLAEDLHLPAQPLLSFSRSSVVVSTSLLPWSISACLTQFLREFSETPSSLRTCEIGGLFEKWTSRIASILDSGLYCDFAPGTQNSFPR